MTILLGSILERVLSQELGRQKAWAKEDESNGFDVSARKKAVEEIEAFMKENGLNVLDTYVYEEMLKYSNN